MLKLIVTILGLSLLTLGCDRVVYVYADAGPQQWPQDDAGALPDAPEVPSDAPDASSPVLDAGTWVPGTCEPDREPGAVSHNDCRGLDTPVCDAISETCAPLPTDSCDACETDVQCREGVSLRADCIFLAGDVEANNDSVCLYACDTTADCGHLGSLYECRPFARGTYCAPTIGTRTHCRAPDGQRLSR